MTLDLLHRHRKADSDDFDASVWNALVGDLSLILNDLQAKGLTFEEARQQLIQTALFRVNEILLPAFERVTLYLQAGFLDAPIAEGAEIVFAVGASSVIIAADKRDVFRPSPFVSLIRAGSVDDYAVARTLSYDAATGALALDIVVAAGAVGPHADVIVSATPGGIISQVAFLNAAKAAKTAAETARSQTITARGEAVSAAGAAGAAADDAATLRNQAITARNEAVAAAAAAALFDPAAFQSRDQRGVADGYAALDGDGKVPVTQLPPPPEAPAVDLSAYYTKVELDHATTGKIDKTDRTTAAQYRAATASKVLIADKVWEAAQYVDGGNISGTVNVDMSAALNRKNVINGNLTLGTVTNAKEGQVLIWHLTHNGSNRSLAYNATYWTTHQNEGITLSSTNLAQDTLMGVVRPDGKIVLSLLARGAN